MAKRININFDTKSIKEAIKEFQTIQKKMKSDIPEIFLNKCLDQIILLAENNLNATSLDRGIIANITGGWQRQVKGNSATLINNSDKAVFIEFGVGVVGQRSPHPKASEENYEYNKESASKMYGGAWRFKNDSWLGSDIMNEYVISYDMALGGDEYITTEGQPAQLYLYNALMDMQSQGHFKRIWNEVLDKNL